MELLKDVCNQMTSDLGNSRFTYQRPREESGKKTVGEGAAQERAGNRNTDQPRLTEVASAARAGGSLHAQTDVALGTKLELKKVI